MPKRRPRPRHRPRSSSRPTPSVPAAVLTSPTGRNASVVVMDEVTNETQALDTLAAAREFMQHAAVQLSRQSPQPLPQGWGRTVLTPPRSTTFAPEQMNVWQPNRDGYRVPRPRDPQPASPYTPTVPVRPQDVYGSDYISPEAQQQIDRLGEQVQRLQRELREARRPVQAAPAGELLPLPANLARVTYVVDAGITAGGVAVRHLVFGHPALPSVIRTARNSILVLPDRLVDHPQHMFTQRLIDNNNSGITGYGVHYGEFGEAAELIFPSGGPEEVSVMFSPRHPVAVQNRLQTHQRTVAWSEWLRLTRLPADTLVPTEADMVVGQVWVVERPRRRLDLGDG